MSTPIAQWLPHMQLTAGRLQYMPERLSESLTVTAYGAAGTGTVDDAPAIQAALNAAKVRGGFRASCESAGHSHSLRTATSTVAS
ncbi:hypothetical protein ACQB60_40905 [Actinomycetota bacterium Odt1-20B]